jgi:ATP phosphoribosyltransferase regulatory subunit
MPLGTAIDEARRLRQEGWITVAALAPVGDARAEARRLGCSHVLERGTPKEV